MFDFQKGEGPAEQYHAELGVAQWKPHPSRKNFVHLLHVLDTVKVDLDAWEMSSGLFRSVGIFLL